MQRKRTVQSLSIRVQTVLGNTIFNFFQLQHKNCAECQEFTVPGDVCKTLGSFREELAKLPMYAFTSFMPVVFNKSAGASSQDDKYALMYTTLNFFFPLKLFTKCRLTEMDMDLIMKFGSDIERLHLYHWNRGHNWPTQESVDINFNKLLLADMVEMTPRIKVLNLFNQQVNIRSFLVALSRNCHNIQELHQICVTDEITEYLSQLFCYKNWPLNTETHLCCQSIQIFDVYRKFQYTNPTKSEIKGLEVLCENLTNLKSFGDMFQVQKVLSRITDSDLNDESKLRNSLLNLKAASFQDFSKDEDDFIPHLKDFSQLKRFHVRKINPHPNYSIDDVISFTGRLTELVSLELESSENVNLSMIRSICPNLIKLGLRVIAPGCVNINEGSHMTFKNLEYFWICTDGTAGIDYNWLRVVSPNIEIMCIAIRNVQFGEETFLSAVAEYNFPKLQCVYIMNHGLTENGIKQLFRHCPSLETVGSDFNNLQLSVITNELKQLYGKNCTLYSLGNCCCFFHNELVNYCMKWSASNMFDCC